MNLEKVFIAGHGGMVGSAVLNNLKQQRSAELIYASSSELDLRNQAATLGFMKKNKPDVVIVAAARVGGILANNSYPWQFLYENLMIEANLINAAHENGVEKLIFLGSSCIYPKFAEQPLKEESLLTGALEPTNEWYAIAKIAGVKLCQALNKQYNRNYVSLMPTNLYGPRDNFDYETSHVLPAMIRKFHDAKQNGHADVILWGSGTPMREFLHVDDLAAAVNFVLESKGDLVHDLVNVGTGIDLTIRQLAEVVQNTVGHEGRIVWDSSKPDGTPRKLMDVERMKELGWQAEIPLEEGIRSTYKWFLENIDSIKELEIKS